MNLIMTCLFYSPIIPLAIPIGFVGSVFSYWVEKYSLLRRNKMPEMFSKLMATFFANFMPWVITIWAVNCIIMISRNVPDEANRA